MKAPILVIFLMQLPPSNMPRGWEVTIQKMWPAPEPAFTVLCTPDDGYGWHLKHVESTCRLINRLLCVASHWTIINIYHCVQCAFEAELRSCLVYLSVIVSGHFLKRCIHATATMILCHINSHKIFSQCRPVRYIANMLSTSSVAATAENTISLLSMIF